LYAKLKGQRECKEWSPSNSAVVGATIAADKEHRASVHFETGAFTSAQSERRLDVISAHGFYIDDHKSARG
jgi:hypothetical protein